MQEQRERGFLTGIEDQLRASEEAADQETAAKDDLGYLRSIPMQQLELLPTKGGKIPTVPTREEIQPIKESVPEEQEAFFFSSAPIDQLPPKQRVLRVMTESDTRKTVQNLRGRTGLPDAELKTTLAELRDEGVISYKPIS